MASKKTVSIFGTRNTLFTRFFEKFDLGESYTSLLLGIVVVIFASVLAVSFVKGMRVRELSLVKQETSSAKTERVLENKKTEPKVENAVNAKEYTVAAGDNLWAISERYYKSGYNWVDIAKANNLENPGILYVGTKLKMPDVETKILVKTVETKEIATASSIQKITDDTYTIKRGDDLWDIAVRAYGDGFRWVDIAKANNLSNPSLIFADNTLKIPR